MSQPGCLNLCFYKTSCGEMSKTINVMLNSFLKSFRSELRHSTRFIIVSTQICLIFNPHRDQCMNFHTEQIGWLQRVWRFTIIPVHFMTTRHPSADQQPVRTNPSATPARRPHWAESSNLLDSPQVLHTFPVILGTFRNRTQIFLSWIWGRLI